MPAAPRIIDTLCNGFWPSQREFWESTSASSPVKIRRDPADSFVEPEGMIARMDELGIATLLVPTSDLIDHGQFHGAGYERLASRWEMMEELTRRYPGRIAALAVVNPAGGMAEIRAMRRRLDQPWVVGMYLHTHSWDRRYDHADYYPFYTLCSDYGVPIAMQVGTSGGGLPSECSQPIILDRPAAYFPETIFIQSHTGWPWVAEATAMALRYANIYIGTGAYPPRHWDTPLKTFLRGPGRRKVMFATNFPTVGHRHGLSQVDELELPEETRAALLGDTARAVFNRLPR
jgi:predicted TIM-barrel fold metal-dependent hydrolase